MQKQFYWRHYDKNTLDLLRGITCGWLFALETAADIVFSWLKINQMKGNAEKCQLIVNSMQENISIMVDNNSVSNRQSAKILGIVFDNNLTFDSHIKSL